MTPDWRGRGWGRAPTPHLLGRPRSKRRTKTSVGNDVEKLVGMQNDVATVENGLAVPQRGSRIIT